MVNLSDLLEDMEEELRPEADRVVEAERRARTLIADLHRKEDAWMFEVVDEVPHGSHARDTAIVGFKDIDYLVVLNPTALNKLDGTERSARDTVARLARMIRERRGGLVAQGTIEVRSQEHSVGVKYPGTRLRVDLVPALRTQQHGCFLIPNRATDEWMETRPYLLKGRLTRAEGENAHVKKAIRLVKGWRRARGKAMQIPSYAVELLLSEWAGAHAGLSGLVRAFFDRLATAHAGQRLALLGEPDRSPITVRDPWSGVNVADELSADHRARLIENARRALEELDEAKSLATEGRGRGALGVLRRLFKGNYD